LIGYRANFLPRDNAYRAMIMRIMRFTYRS